MRMLGVLQSGQDLGLFRHADIGVFGVARHPASAGMQDTDPQRATSHALMATRGAPIGPSQRATLAGSGQGRTWHGADLGCLEPLASDFREADYQCLAQSTDFL